MSELHEAAQEVARLDRMLTAVSKVGEQLKKLGDMELAEAQFKNRIKKLETAHAEADANLTALKGEVASLIARRDELRSEVEKEKIAKGIEVGREADKIKFDAKALAASIVQQAKTDAVKIVTDAKVQADAANRAKLLSDQSRAENEAVVANAQTELKRVQNAIAEAKAKIG